MRRFFISIAVVATLVGSIALWNARDWMRTNRTLFYQNQENHERAIATIEPLALHPPNHLQLTLLVKSYLALDRRDDLNRALESIEQQHPEWAAPTIERAKLLLREGQWQHAWPLMDWALSRDDSPALTSFDACERAIAQAAFDLGDGNPSHALQVLSEQDFGLEEDETHPSADLALLLRGMALIRLGEWNSAIAPLEQSITLETSNPLAHAALALALASRGDWHLARHEVDVAHTLGPEVAMPFILGELTRQVNLGTANSTPNTPPTGISRDAALTWLGSMLADSEEWASLIALGDPQPGANRLNSAPLWEMMGRARFFSGDLEGQEATRQRAFEIDPHWPFDPNWPGPLNEIEPYIDENLWDRIALPRGDNMPAGTTRYGNFDELFSVFSDTSFDLTVTVDQSGWYRITMLARGRPSNGIWPVIEIGTPGAPPTPKYLNNHFERYQFSNHFFTAGDNTLRLSLVNDTELLVPGEDRFATLLGMWIQAAPIAEAQR